MVHSSEQLVAEKVVKIAYSKGIGEGTLPWAIFRFRIFSNHFSQKLKK